MDDQEKMREVIEELLAEAARPVTATEVTDLLSRFSDVHMALVEGTFYEDYDRAVDMLKVVGEARTMVARLYAQSVMKKEKA